MSPETRAAPYAGAGPAGSVPRPAWFRLCRGEPAEDSSGQEGVDEAVDVGLEGRGPGSAVPDRVRPGADGVADERGGAGETEDGEVGRAGRERPPRDVGGEDLDDDAVEEPVGERLPHRRRPALLHDGQ